MRIFSVVTLAGPVLAVALAAGTAAAQDSAQSENQGQGQNQSQNQSQTQGQASAQAETASQCMQDLRAFNRQLVGDDYGVAGPYGYGLGAERGYTGMMATPMGQMRTAMRTAQMFAGHGLEEPCQAVLAGMRTMRQRYEEVRGQADMDAAEIADWRTNWLEKAVPVEELRGTMALTYVVGADVRNLQDEDLGNIETTLVDPDSGEIRYALISRGGFLGIGEEVVPVPWDRLKVTPLPFRDTFVLDVSEDTVEEAPSYEDDDLTAADIGQKVDDYWARALGQG